MFVLEYLFYLSKIYRPWSTYLIIKEYDAYKNDLCLNRNFAINTINYVKFSYGDCSDKCTYILMDFVTV